jgi:hypothetical protein
LTAHIEDFKRKRLAGEILQLESEEERSREERLRRDLQESPKSGRPQANAKYGWLGRKMLFLSFVDTPNEADNALRG